MSDELKKFFQREFDELKHNKIRVAALVACVVLLLIFWASDDTAPAEKISLNEPPAKVPATKDLPEKPLPVAKNLDGVTLVLGANRDALTVADPFAGAEKPKTPPPKVQPIPPQLPPQQIPPPPENSPPKPQEKISLIGTAISGAKKTAMFLRGKETIFLTVGDEVNGRKIVDITADFVLFADGARLYLQKELN